MRGLGLGSINCVGTVEGLDECLCFGCVGVGVGSVGGEWVGGLDQDLGGGVVLCLYEL